MKENLDKTLVTLRPSVPTDKNFIYSTWLKGLYYGNDWFKAIDQDVYFVNYQNTLNSILAKPGTIVTVACLKDDLDVILGYSVSHGEYLDWIWVKPIWRNLGIATDLVPANITAITHLTKSGQSIWHKKYPNWIFNPFMV
jgi:GNAT superfamily N-acetyltransferase